MANLVFDQILARQLVDGRRAAGADRFDEVWEGTYVMAPLADDEHQDIQAGLVMVLRLLLGTGGGKARVRAGVNITDRQTGWQENYRCPDVVVFAEGTTAENHRTYWLGGPDFAVEILSPGDPTPHKLPFYASVNVRELLVIDRDPWSIELHRLRDGRFSSAGHALPGGSETLESHVLPLTFRLLPPLAGERPMIEVAHPESGQRWAV